MTALVNLRNTVSGQAKEYTQEEAERILAHPIFGKVNKVVRTAKPEVLSADTDDVEDAENVSVPDTNEEKEADK